MHVADTNPVKNYQYNVMKDIGPKSVFNIRTTVTMWLNIWTELDSGFGEVGTVNVSKLSEQLLRFLTLLT